MSVTKDTFAEQAHSAKIMRTLCVESFLNENYGFRRNVLNGKLEFADQKVQPDVWRPLTQEALNSIILRAKREEVCEDGSPKQDIELYVHSEEVPVFDPIKEHLDHLPKWDGQNHVAALFNRLPGIDTEKTNFLTIWFRSTVAHWLTTKDTLHGNECVPVLIGAQGCGKTTFFRRLLPPELRQYYLDHINLSNKFDKEMALTNNLIVNLDELDAIRPTQHASLKQTLSKNKVNGRPIYGAVQEDRHRYASFVATTNNPHPLTDATGSRRYICITIPEGLFINNVGDINYPQLYAQLLYEINEAKAPYWFNNEEVARLQVMNQSYTQQKDLAQIVEACFRKPLEDEHVKALNSRELLEVIRQQFPSVPLTHSTRVHLGLAMKELGYTSTKRGNISYYKVIPTKVA